MIDTPEPEHLNARTPERLSHLDRLALCAIGVWCAGAALTHVVGIWSGVGGAAIGLGIAVLLLARPILAPLLRPTGQLLAWGIGATMMMLVVTYGGYPVLHRQSPTLSRNVEHMYAVFQTAGPLWAERVVLPLVILAEELIWRGVVQEALQRRYSTPVAVVLAGAAYAISHAPVGSPLLVLLALTCGLFWSTLRVWTRSLIPGLVSHFVWDVLVIVLLPLA